MKYLLAILIILVSCRNNPKSFNNGQNSYIKNIEVDQIDEKVHSSEIIETNQIHTYPHKLDTNDLSKYLKDPNIDTSVLSYCNRRLKITDNDKTIEFLEMISQKNDKFFPLYFRIFNNIIENSDGAVSELMGPYCFKFVINYPNEVLKHFITDQEDLNLYSMFLGVEFNLKEYGSSNQMMDFDEFKKYLSEKVDFTNDMLKSVSDSLYAKIEKTMKNMN